MKPILYAKGTNTFTTNGLGQLSDCISCLVTEERNGGFEVEIEYPITGSHYDDIEIGSIICVSHDEQKDIQPFIIYQITKPISGIVTIYAHHISYLLSTIVVSPFTADSCTNAFTAISSHSMSTNPFTFWTDNVTAGNINLKIPTSARAALGGVEGSILDIYGGEYEFDKFTVKNYAHRGSNNGVTIRYGKNLKDVTYDRSDLDLFDSVVPYWTDGENVVVYGSIVTGTGQTMTLVTPLDLSADFQSKPTVTQLQNRALAWLDANTPWIPTVNIEVDFVALWQTEEYESIAPLERVQLCDTVTVIYTDLGVQATAKVIRVVWDALLERYDTIELGDAKSTFADTIISQATSEVEGVLSVVPTKGMMDDAIDHATDLITGGLGGHIVFLYDANGKPTDMLVMDTEDVSTAVNVLRINVNGIGFSSTGVNGSFSTAWTLDGAFLANYITTGTMSCNRLKGGTLTLGGGSNANGQLIVKDANNKTIGTFDKDGLFAQALRISGTSGASYIRFNFFNSSNKQIAGFTLGETTGGGWPSGDEFYGKPAVGVDVDYYNNGEMWASGVGNNFENIIPRYYYRSGSYNLSTDDQFFMTGVYWFKQGCTLTGTPNSAINGWLEVYGTSRYDVGIAPQVQCKQIWHRQGSSPNTFRDEFVRIYDGSSWSDWAKIVVSGQRESIDIKNADFTVGTAPSSDVYGVGHRMIDNAGNVVGYVRAMALTDGYTGMQFETLRGISGTTYYNTLNLLIGPTGDKKVNVSSSAIWRKALVVPTQTDFTTTTVPITVGTLAANGGTKYNQSTAHGIDTTAYRILGIISFELSGNQYTNCTVTKLNTSGANILWSVANLGSTATGSITLNVRILKVAI